MKAISVEERIRYLTRSDLAIRKVLSTGDLPINIRAEQLLLLGRNAKSRWRYEWNDKGEGKRKAALRSSWLKESFAEYSKGFDVDLNHYFSGLNAMTMLTILTILARGLPDVWSSIHDSPKEADAELRRYREQLADLTPAVKLSLEAERKRLEARDQKAGARRRTSSGSSMALPNSSVSPRTNQDRWPRHTARPSPRRKTSTATRPRANFSFTRNLACLPITPGRR